MADEYGGQLGQMWRAVYDRARQIADEQIKAAIGNIVRGGKVVPSAIAPGPPGTVLTSPSGGGGTSWSAPGGGSGTVTSVGLSLPGSIIAVTGSPITAAGTLDGHVLVNQAAHTVWAGDPVSGSNPPTFRLLVQADIPALDAAAIATGTFASARLPLAATSAFGAVKPDGTTITIAAGVISAAGGGGGSYAPLTGDARVLPTYLPLPPISGTPTVPSFVTQTDIATSGFNAFPAILHTPAGKTVVFYQAGASGDPGLGGSVVYNVSTDAGATWSAPTTLAMPASGRNRGVGGACRTATGRWVVSLLDTDESTFWHTSVVYSDDEGSTWSTPVAVAPYTGNFSFPAGPILAQSSGILLLQLYVQDAGDTANRAGFMRSTDNGLTWPAFVPCGARNTNYNEMTPIELPDTRILVYVRQDGASTFFTCESLDDGATFGTPAALAALAITPGMAGAIWVPGSRQIVLYYRAPGSEHCYWTYSNDLGQTYAGPSLYSSAIYGYSAICAIGPNLIGIAIGQELSAGTSYMSFVSMACGNTGGGSGDALPALGASGIGHQAGIAPDPGSVAGTARYLREDATWAAPPGVCGPVYDSTGTIIRRADGRALLGNSGY